MNKKSLEIKTTPVPFSLEVIKDDLYILENRKSHYSQEHLINKAFIFHTEGNFLEASKCYKDLLNLGIKDPRVFSNYGFILKNIGKFKEAEFILRESININPKFVQAYYNLGLLFKDLGKLKEAEFQFWSAIKIKPDYANAYSNHGAILKDLNNLNQAEKSLQRAIELNPELANAHYNLGCVLIKKRKLKEALIPLRRALKIKTNFFSAHYSVGCILINLGKFEDAELSLLNALKINPNFAAAYLLLSRIKNPITKKNKWQEYLFSKTIINNNFKKDQIDIYFARANILHNTKNYIESSKYLKIANNLKITLRKPKTDILTTKNILLNKECDIEDLHRKEKELYPSSIFIVGMPRSGSTLLESILSMNPCVYDLGEINILEESYLEWKHTYKKFTLSDIYWSKIKNSFNTLNITTNKWLYNYSYAGIIAKHINNSKIIHCFRNPLDNILSIYRANFTTGNEYSSSLVHSAKVYLDQEEIMVKYKNRFRSKIYDLNYDSLVSNPNKEIKSLISWLGWEWDDTYLSPHLNPRSVSTASNIQVRYPINAKSIGGWKNYKDMLKPAIEIISMTNKYRNIISNTNL